MKEHMRNTFCTGAAFFAAVQLTGCATRQVALQYNSSMNPVVVSGAPTVSIGDFKDTRDDSSLGCVRNGWGAKLAEVRAKLGEPPVSTWISTALADELKRAGCSVVPNDSTAARFVISGEVQRVFVDAYMRLQGEISIALCVKSGDKTVLNRLYHAEASKMNWWNSSKEFQQTLDMTLQELMKKTVPDLLTAMSMKSELLPATTETQNSLPAVAAQTTAKQTAPAITVPVVEPVVSAPIPVQAAAISEPKLTVDVTAQLKKLKELKDLGLVTEEEYEAKRKELVGQL